MLVTNVMCGIVSVIEDCVCVCENVFVCVCVCKMHYAETADQPSESKQTADTQHQRTDKARYVPSRDHQYQGQLVTGVKEGSRE